MEATNQKVYQWRDIKDCEDIQINSFGFISVDLTGLTLPSRNLFKFLRANSPSIGLLCISKCKINVLELHMIFSIVRDNLQELRMTGMTIHGPKNGRGMQKLEMPHLKTLQLHLEVAEDYDFIGAVIIAKNLRILEFPAAGPVEPNTIRPDIKSILSAQKATMKKLTLSNVFIDDSLVNRLMIWGFRHLVLKACTFEGKQLSMNVNKTIKELELIDMDSESDSEIEFGICNILRSCHGARKLSLVNVTKTAGMMCEIDSCMNEFLELELEVSETLSGASENIQIIEIEHTE